MAIEALGYIECPHCGKEEMRITHDKNGHPFGYCEGGRCNGQLRVGPAPYRVEQFIERYPWAAKKVAPVREREEARAPDTVPVSEPKPEAKAAPVPKSAPSIAGPFDFLFKQKEAAA